MARRYLGYRVANNVLAGGPVYGKGLRGKRYSTQPGIHPYDEIEWETPDAVITNADGKVVFEQKGVEVPKSYSQTATNIAVSKYFYGRLGTPARETSIRQLMDRVAKTIAGFGRRGGYFLTEDDAAVFEAELTSILVNQRAAFNSPVWFNVGVNPKPQCSACFINSVHDDMRSILNLAVTGHALQIRVRFGFELVMAPQLQGKARQFLPAVLPARVVHERPGRLCRLHPLRRKTRRAAKW